jgi:hypothetical protein
LCVPSLKRSCAIVGAFVRLVNWMVVRLIIISSFLTPLETCRLNKQLRTSELLCFSSSQKP